MTTIQKQCISFLLVLVLIFGTIPSVSAAEITTETPTEPTESATEETFATEAPPPEVIQPEVTTNDIGSRETEISVRPSNNEIASITDAEINGNPTTFATIFLKEEIQIPCFDHIQSKAHIPLYSVYLKNQLGYENNYYIAYCIEPGIVQNAEASYDGHSSTIGNLSSESTMYTYLSPAQIKAIAVVLMYGQAEIARRADEESVRLEKLRRWAATQLIIWEIASGWRSSAPPYVCTSSILYDAVTPTLETKSKVWGNTFNLDNITSAYNDISNKIAKHFAIPSFASECEESAPIYDLIPTDSGDYTITLVDTNNTLSNYLFSNTDIFNFSLNGNRITINVSGNVTGDIVFSPTKSILNLDEQVFWFWEKDNNQRMMSCKTVPDLKPYPCYFILRTKSTGKLELTKTTEDGQYLSGWQFGIYSDSSCSNLISGPHTTDADGKIDLNNLTAGTVYVKELGHEDSTINVLYSCDSTNPQKVVLTAGETAKVSFQNRLNTGGVKLVKQTNTGNHLGGWLIGLYYDAACTKPVSGSPFTTSTNGSTTVSGLKPGTLYAKELPTDDPYWEFDTSVKEVKIVANQIATVTFTNTHLGRIKFQKTTNTGNHRGGWTFRVTDAGGNYVGDYTTDANGEAYTDNLALGRYTVQEISTGDPYWNCELGFHDVTVKAGETVLDEWTNREQGLGWFRKTTNTGENITGWEITIYSDGACTKEVCIVNPVEDGKVGYYFEPGIYYAKETGDMFGRDKDEYWILDSTVYKFQIKPHEETTVTFSNTHYGKLNIRKTMDTDGRLDGWQFRVTDFSGKKIVGSPFTSDKNGEIHVGNLLPGVYKVEELLPEDSLNFCKSENPQTVTVKQGETAEVSFTNALRPGKLTIEKLDLNSEHLAGAKFLLEWSEDGSLWWPIEYSDSKDVIKGFCSNPDVIDGTLTTTESGIIEWGNLHPDLYYRITELEAPEGYVLLTEVAYEDKLPADDVEVVLRVINCEAFTLPKTGFSMELFFHVSRILCIAICGTMLFFSFRKKRRA